MLFQTTYTRRVDVLIASLKSGLFHGSSWLLLMVDVACYTQPCLQFIELSAHRGMATTLVIHCFFSVINAHIQALIRRLICNCIYGLPQARNCQCSTCDDRFFYPIASCSQGIDTPILCNLLAGLTDPLQCLTVVDVCIHIYTFGQKPADTY